MRFPKTRILIFAKAPVPGLCKTRMIPALGREGAAALAERLLRGTVERVSAAQLAPVELWCAPDADHPLFRRLTARFALRAEVQQGEDLGARMLNAATSALANADAVVLIGTDCPDLGPEYLEQALTLLGEHAVVLGPADDGGYVMLGIGKGCGRALPRLFEAMPWGSDRIAAITRQRLEASGMRWAELPSLADLDRPEDLERFGALASKTP